jgi:hypothetical protein
VEELLAVPVVANPTVTPLAIQREHTLTVT